MSRDTLHLPSAADDLLALTPGTPLLIVLWRPNLEREPPLRVVTVRAGTADVARARLATPGLRPRSGEHAIHVEPAADLSSAAAQTY